ncbi:hypothetical protein ACFY04_08385 [Streptomyces sp. NPDC001549]|uniref:hypothetical protein n=1 Tax=Streptomyces sp. NPDC001549 TaxID=3364586 RepID=UPI0036C10BC2
MKRILVIGGSRYFGKTPVTRARGAGDAVTVLNRGSGAPPPGVGRLVADRDDEEALRVAPGPRLRSRRRLAARAIAETPCADG